MIRLENPTKPIGAFMSKEEADILIAKGEMLKKMQDVDIDVL